MKNDEEEPSFPLIPISELIRFMEAMRANNLACRVCGHEDWAYNVPDGAAGGGLPVLMQDGQTSGKYLAVIALVCMNCGFIRYHSYKLIRDWLDVHPSDGLESTDHEYHPNVARDHVIAPAPFVPAEQHSGGLTVRLEKMERAVTELPTELAKLGSNVTGAVDTIKSIRTWTILLGLSLIAVLFAIVSRSFGWM